MNSTDAFLAQLGAGQEYAEPYSDRILVRPIEREKTTPGGLVVPDSARSDSAPIGLVLAVGPWVGSEDPTHPKLETGDRIAYDPGYGVALELGEERLLLIPEHSVEAIIRTKGA